MKHHPWWHWSRNTDAWNEFSAIYGDYTLPWEAAMDAEEDEDGFSEQLWAIRGGLAERPKEFR